MGSVCSCKKKPRQENYRFDEEYCEGEMQISSPRISNPLEDLYNFGYEEQRVNYQEEYVLEVDKQNQMTVYSEPNTQTTKLELRPIYFEECKGQYNIMSLLNLPNEDDLLNFFGNQVRSKADAFKIWYLKS